MGRWFRRAVILVRLALVFIAGGFAEWVVARTNTGARFRDDYAAIDIATSYMKKLGQDMSDYDAGSCTTYDGYCVYFEIKPKFGVSTCGGDIKVTLDKNGNMIQVIRGQ